MGITNLFRSLRVRAPTAIEELERSGWPFVSGKSVAFDASIIAYKFINVVRTEEIPPFVTCFNRFMEKCLRHGVEPYMVFDGVPPEAKTKEIERRRKTKSASLKPSIAHFDAMREICGRIGANIVDAPQEGELECVNLIRKGICSVVVSNDGDCLAAGAPQVVIWFDSSKAQLVDLNEVMRCMGPHMTPEAFTEFCIGHGCDFGKRIPKFGEVALWNAFTNDKCTSMEQVIALGKSRKDKRFEESNLEAFRETYPICKEIFTNLVQDNGVVASGRESPYFAPPTETTKCPLPSSRKTAEPSA